MFNNLRYSVNILKIKIYDDIICNTIGSPEGIEYYCEKIKNIAEKSLPLVTDSKRRRNLQKIIETAETTIANCDY